MRTETGFMVACVALALSACQGSERILVADTGVDTRIDPWDVPWDTLYDTWPYDTWHEDTDFPDAYVDGGPCTVPPRCMNAGPDPHVIGGPCISDVDCGGSFRCLTEITREFEGEIYVSWPAGTCAAWGEGEEGCVPGDPSTCAYGATCIYYGSSEGSEHFACIDACKATDTSWNLYDWNCGCRAGYECSITAEACLPGCSNDRECCEVWDDVDGDMTMEAGEVYTDEVCTNWCDGDDPEEYPSDDCMASFSCINEGNPDATWHVECLFDSDCYEGGRCLNEIYYHDPDTGEPLYPGGACMKERCELAGRGCGVYADTLGTITDPVYECFATCHTGYGPEDGDLNPCRHPAGGHPYTCWPYLPERWFPASIAGSDGLCLPATIPSIDPPVADLCELCTRPDDCASPRGLGTCFEAMGTSFCTASCNESLAQDGICGAAAIPGDVAPGVCIGLCVCGCDTPEGTLGANGCAAGLACYPNDGSYTGGDIAWKHMGDADPSGFCLPACASSMDCSSFWSGATTCNTTSGVCG